MDYEYGYAGTKVEDEDIYIGTQNEENLPKEKTRKTFFRKKNKEKEINSVVSYKMFLGLNYLYYIPIIGFLACIIMALVPKNKNLKNHARAMLTWSLTWVVVSFVAIFLMKSVFKDYFGTMEQYKILFENRDEISEAIEQFGGVEGLNETLEQFGGMEGLNETLEQFGGMEGLNETLEQFGGMEGLNETLEQFGGMENLGETLEQFGGMEGLGETLESFSEITDLFKQFKNGDFFVIE